MTYYIVAGKLFIRSVMYVFVLSGPTQSFIHSKESVTYQVMRFSGLYEVNISACVNVDNVVGLVGWQQQLVVTTFVRQPRQKLRLRV